MTDHPVLIPTSEGPVGGIVSEPDAERRAALCLLVGHGRPARSGVNAFWTRLARRLSGLGLTVLRIDHSREGETLPIGEGGGGQAWRRDLDMRILGQVLPWFRERVGDAPLHLAGACSGARLAIELAGREPARISGLFLVVPYLKALVELGPDGEPVPAEPAEVDPVVVACMRAVLSRGPSWIVTGELDTPDVPLLERLLGRPARGLEVEVVPGATLHFLDQPDVQEQAERRLVARLTRALGEADSPPRP